ncbi:LacI family transcriptional regulator [Clostridiales bacterium COT073_COT-073]|nr:LacI family transcriptional regulator [Clostridiales bacterium COT073_COT-073]
MKRKNVTIREVATLAGVSISTVSRYLADPKSVLPLSAYNIKNAIRELQYEPNVFAQNLRRGKSNVIGLVVPHMEYFFGKVCSVISDYFFERGFVTFICKSDSDGAKEKFYIQELLNRKTEGIILAPSGQNTAYLQNVTKTYRNMVGIDRQEEIGCDIVLENHGENAYQLVSWLLKNKPAHQILLLFGWRDSFNTRMCMAGSNRALQEAEISEERILRVYTARKIEVIAQALEQLAAKTKAGDRPLIIAFGSDILEYVMIGVHKKYPEWLENVNIAGFAQAGIVDKLGLNCSLVIKNPEEVGIVAAELLYKRIIGEGKKADNEAAKYYEIKVKYQF